MSCSIARGCSIILLITSVLCSATTALANVSASTTQGRQALAARTMAADFPIVDPDYMYDQLFYMATHFQHREAGYTPADPYTASGHDAFAAYWTQEMIHNLQGFGPQTLRDGFLIKGWQGRPATTPAVNVEVSVPGITHPEQVVVIGCHYDGEAISTQSANDDASGCAIELGVAKAIGTYWHTHHVYPARTLRFVIFDAEEQGLFGSFHYLNSTVNGDTHNLIAMFNEEQNGIAYPLRYLGNASNPRLPFYIDLSPLTNNQLYNNQENLPPVQRQNIAHFRDLMQQAVAPVFAQFRAMGFEGLTYHGDDKQDHAQPIFTDDQISNIHQEDDTLGGSDQIPFTLAGVPCATFVGNATYYSKNPPPWSYPFDQRQDTIQLMNTFADGSSQKSNALTLALALPGMLTTWMLHQPHVLGEGLLDTGPIAAISDIGQVKVDKGITLDAYAAFDPKVSNIPLTYAWDFGDGAKADGVSVSHTYISAGTYTLTLSVGSPTGTRHVSKILIVTEQTIVYNNPYGSHPETGDPPHNPQVVLPQADDHLSDKVVRMPVQEPATAVSSGPAQGIQIKPPEEKQAMPFGSIAALVGGIVLILASVGAVFIVFRRRRAWMHK